MSTTVDTLIALALLPPQRALVVGCQDLALECQQRGMATTYVADHDFIRGRRGLTGGMDEVVLAVHAARDALQAQGIAIPVFGGGVWSAVGALTKTADPAQGRPGLVKPTWDLVVVDTNDPWSHPSCWTHVLGEPPILALAELLRRERGVLAFKVLERDSTSRGPGYPCDWRVDWADFLAPAFAAPLHARIDGSDWLIAQRNGLEITPGESCWLEA